MKKEQIPLVVLAFVVVALLAWWLSQQPAETPLPTAVPANDTPAQTPEAKEPETVPTPPATGTPNGALPAGVKVIGQTTWGTYANEKWHFSFKYQTDWKLGTVKSSDGDIDQVSIDAEEGNILISRNIPIAQPALLKSTVSTRTIAGQQVEVREYENPNEQYASYHFFTLVSGNYEYYVSIQSLDSSSKFSDDFIERIAPK